MTRSLTLPKIVTRQNVQPVQQGGTGVGTLAEIPDALALVKNSSKDQDGGPVGLDANGKLSGTRFAGANGTNVVNVDGPLSVTATTVNTYQITDYDSNRVYTVSVDSGTVSRSGDTITFTAPGSAGTSNLTINGRAIPITITLVAPATPSIISPVTGANTLSANDVRLTATAYNANGSGANSGTDWQVATDSNFTNIVKSSIADVVNRTAWSANSLSASTTYFARMRYKGANGNYSNYSPTISFTTQAFSTMTIEESKMQGKDSGVAYSGQQALDLAISSDGTRVAIGGWFNPNVSPPNGAVYVFLRTGTSWAQEAKIVDPIPNNVSNDQFSYGALSMSADGARIAIGARNRKSESTGVAQTGAAFVFSRSGTTWSQETVIYGPDNTQLDNFGHCVAISPDGTRMAVTMSKNGFNGSTTSKVYIYLRSGSSWSAETNFAASDIAVGDYFGQSLSFASDGTRLAVGAAQKTVNSVKSGAVYVFLRTGTSWAQEARIVVNNPVANEGVGWTVSLDSSATRLAIGNYGNVRCHVYNRVGSVWSEEAVIVNSDYNISDNFGQKVSLTADGSKLAVSADASSPGNASITGAAYIFARTGSVWNQSAKVSASDRPVNMRFSSSVALSGDASRMAVCGPDNLGNATGSGGWVYVYR